MVTRYVRPNASHLPGGTGTGDGLTYGTAWAGFANIPNNVLSGATADELIWAGTFQISVATGLPVLTAVSASARVTMRGGYPGDPAVVQVIGAGNVFMSLNRSFINFDNIEFIGNDTQAVYIQPGISNHTYTNCIFRGTKETANSVFHFDDAGGANFTDFTFGTGTQLLGTATYGIRWVVFANVATATTLTNITFDGFSCTNFLSRHSAIGFRIDPGAVAGCKMQNIKILNSTVTNLRGMAWAMSITQKEVCPGFLMDNCTVDGVTGYLPAGEDTTLGAGLGVGGFGYLNGERPTIRRSTFKNILNAPSGGIDTFYGTYLIEDCYFENITTVNGEIDGSAIIADTGTTGLTIRRCVAENIYGDQSADSITYTGGTALTILQAENVVVESYYAENVRIGISYGNPLIAQYNPISSVTVSGTTATFTTSKTLSAEAIAAGAKLRISGFTPTVFNGTFSPTITGANTFTVTLPSAPGANPSVIGSFTVFGPQSSDISTGGMKVYGCDQTTWFVGAINDQMANNKLSTGNVFTVKNPSLPLFVQYYPTAGVITQEKGNFYYGSAKQDTYGRYAVTTSTNARIGRNSRR